MLSEAIHLLIRPFVGWYDRYNRLPVPRSPLEDLPDELLLYLVTFICNNRFSDRQLLHECRRDYGHGLPSLARLCLASRWLHELLTPSLYYYVLPVDIPQWSWQERLEESLGMWGARTRFAHTRLLYCPSTDTSVMSCLHRMTNLRAVRVPDKVDPTHREDGPFAQDLVPYHWQTKTSLEGIVISSISFHRILEALVYLQPEWAVFVDCRDTIPAAGPSKRYRMQGANVPLSAASFEGGGLFAARKVMQRLNVSVLRKLELQALDADDFVRFWTGVSYLKNLEQLVLSLHSRVDDLSCLTGKVPPCSITLKRSDANSRSALDRVYQTLPRNTRSLTPDPHAILREDGYLREALQYTLLELTEVRVPARGIAGVGIEREAGHREYAQAIDWLRDVCRNRNSSVTVEVTVSEERLQ